MIKYKSKLPRFVFIEIILLFLVYISDRIYKFGNTASIIIFFCNSGYIQIANYIVAKSGDNYIKNVNYDLYYKYYKTTLNVYPQFIAIRLIFNSSVDCSNIKTIKKEGIAFIIFVVASLLACVLILLSE